MMSGIQGKNTKPELIIRFGLHKRGFRYRLHDKSLPGKPDIVLPKYNAIVLVNGCFWHGHDCHLFKLPVTRRGFWRTKINTNRNRDLNNLGKCRRAGWRVLTIWECALKGKSATEIASVLDRIAHWLQSEGKTKTIRGSTTSRRLADLHGESSAL